MNYINYNDVYVTLGAHGFLLDGGLEIGTMQRVKRSGRSQKGWYVVHAITLDDGSQSLVGSFGYWEGAEKYSEKISPGRGLGLNKDQVEAIKAQHREAVKKADAIRKAEAEKASVTATQAFHQYINEGESSYLTRKGVRAHGLKFSPSGNGTIAIPMRDTKGKIWGLQIIRGKDRGGKLEKEYWPKGLDKKGHYHTLGSINHQTKIALLGEGYATMATNYQASGIPCAVAFDAGNLVAVALALHKEFPRLKILVCADDDYLTDGNPGCKNAEAAAVAIGNCGAWIKPLFPSSREEKKLTDFNDLANFPNCSESTVMVQIEDAIQSLGWGNADPLGGAALSHGGGGGRRNAVSVMTLDALIERYIPIDDGTGKTVYDTWTNKLVSRDQMIALMPPGLKFDDIKRHPIYLARGAYYLDDVGFDPTGYDVDVKLNLFTGWPMQPKPGGCEKLLETLEWLCSKEANSDDLLWFIIKWMAYPLQNPGAKMASAVILHGPQGTGKSLIFRTLAKIYGKYATVIGNSGIEDKFNADWSDSKLFILAEEIATSNDKWQIKNELKELITGETVRVRAMHRMAYHQKNHMNVAFLSNEDLPIPIEEDDRRHCVVYTPPKLPEQHYADVLEELDNGGVEAFYDYLMKVDLTGFTRHTKPPASLAKTNLINLSMSGDRRFINEWVAGLTHWPVCPCKSQDLYDAYRSWCQQKGERSIRPQNQFLGMVNNLTGWRTGVKRIYTNLLPENQKGTNAVQKSLVIPPDEHLEKSGWLKPPDQTETVWLTEGVFEFKNAKSDEEKVD